jgi:nucleoside-diphosphate-sugar epimerase
MPDDLHVIFGAGQVGTYLARRLLTSGRRVRIARRSDVPAPNGAEVVRGDAADAAFCVSAAQGAAVVYHCMNPPYSTQLWRDLLPRYMGNLIAAAGRSGARLVVLDNLYMLGRPPDGRLDENTPMQPRSRKGEIRAQVAARLFDAHARGLVRAISGRASDFYGPGGTQTHLGDQFWPRMLAGKPGRLAIDPDAIHTYHYIPDVAEGLAALGDAPDDCYGRPWMLHCQPATTLRALVKEFEPHLGRPIAIAYMRPWLVKLLGLFVPIMREIDEMLYQWEGPFIVDDSRFRARFGVEPTPPDPAARETVKWAQEHYLATPPR